MTPLHRASGLLLLVLAACAELPPVPSLAPLLPAVSAPTAPAHGHVPSLLAPESTSTGSSAPPSPSQYETPAPLPTTPESAPLATTAAAVLPASVTATVETSLSPPRAPEPWIFPTPNPDARSLKVARVVDGDTLHLEGASGTFGVRLIGVDTPETVHPTKGVECFGPEASAFTKQLTGRTIKFGTDPTQGEFDRYDRALGYIWLDERLINQELIVRGLAREYTYSKPYRYQKEFRAAQSSAQAKQVGIWSATCGGTLAPVATAKPDASATQPVVEAVAPPSPAPVAASGPSPTPSSSPPGACGPGEIWVNSYTRKDGTVVKGYCRKR